jgi:ADP-heptose:LPS heptosyltransferase
VKQLTILNRAGLGDVILTTALVRDIHATYPGQFDITVNTSFATVWQNNPHARFVRDFPKGTSTVDIRQAFSASIANMHKQKHRWHCLEGTRKAFETLTRIQVKPTKPRGEIFLSDEEKRPILTGKYWVIVAGGKLDMTVKHWHLDKWQMLVNMMAEKGIQAVQVGANCTNHWHPPLQNVLSLVGFTENERDLFSIIHHAEGVICGITGVMHIAAAMSKKCIVIGSASEEPWWEHYSNDWGTFQGAEPVEVPHRYHTAFGKLHCCPGTGCWKKRVVALTNADEVERKDKLCVEPVKLPGQAVANCMMMIQPEAVFESLLLSEPSLEQPRPFFSRTLPYRAPSKENTQPTPEFAVVPKTKAADLNCILDHPLIGGKLTVTVLCFGDYSQLARTCLGSIYNSDMSDRFEIRVFANGCGSDTVNYLRSLPLRKLIISDTNIFKAAACRQLWHDKDDPITTPYVVWMDDDSFVVDFKWPKLLAESIITNHPKGARLFGIKFLHDLRIYKQASYDPNEWFKKAKWYKGRAWSTTGGISAANGTIVPFVSGGFLAIANEMIKVANIPDPRLLHNGIDATIGAQVYQTGYEIKDFNRDKKHIHSSGHKRRGWGEPFQWASEVGKAKFYADNAAKFRQQHGREPLRNKSLIEMP